MITKNLSLITVLLCCFVLQGCYETVQVKVNNSRFRSPEQLEKYIDESVKDAGAASYDLSYHYSSNHEQPDSSVTSLRITYLEIAVDTTVNTDTLIAWYNNHSEIIAQKLYASLKKRNEFDAFQVNYEFSEGISSGLDSIGGASFKYNMLKWTYKRESLKAY